MTLATGLVVAMTSTVQSVRASLELRLISTVGAADARIVHLFNGRFDGEWLERASAWPEVQAATGRLQATLTLLPPEPVVRNGETTERVAVAATGVTPPGEGGADAALTILLGRARAAPLEILVDELAAEALGVEPGDVVLALRPDGAALTVAGVYRRPVLGILQRPEIRLDRATLLRITGVEDELTAVDLKLREGVETEAFVARRAEALPDYLSLEPAEMARAGFDRRVRSGDVMMTIGSSLTFLCCAFIIMTGLTVGVAQRQRELAVLRCVGAARGQIVASQLFLGLLLAAVGVTAGVPVGLGLSAGLVAYFHELLPAGFAPSGLGLRLAFAGATLAGLAGAVYPAWLAGRVRPLKALAVRARPVRWARVALVGLAGVGLVCGQLLLLLPPSEQTRFWLYATVGLPLVLAGYFLLAVPVFAAVTLLVAPSLSRALRLPGDLLRRGVMATPYRLGFTAGALMVGIAILVSTWSNSASFLENWLGRIRFADAFAFNPFGLRESQVDAIEGLPFVGAACLVGHLELEVRGARIFGVEGLAPPNVNAITFQPEAFFRMNELEWVQGDPERAIALLGTSDAILVAEEFLTARNIGVGATLTLGRGRVEHSWEVVGVVRSPGLDIATRYFGIEDAYSDYAVSCVFADLDRVAAVYEYDRAYLMQVDLSEEVSDAAATLAVSEVAPGVLFQSGRAIVETIGEIGGAAFVVNSTIAFAALLLSCLAVGNVLAANTGAREFEYGVLRAVGCLRGQLVRLVLGEAVLLGLAAIVVGTILGLHAAWVGTLMARDLAGLRVPLIMPWAPAIAGWIVLMAMTLLAALPTALVFAWKSPRDLLTEGRRAA